LIIIFLEIVYINNKKYYLFIHMSVDANASEAVEAVAVVANASAVEVVEAVEAVAVVASAVEVVEAVAVAASEAVAVVAVAVEAVAVVEKVKSDLIVDTLLNTLLSEVKGQLAKNGTVFGSSTLHLAIKYVMEAIEKRNLKGLGQKEIAIALINELIKELPNSDEKTLLSGLSQSGAIGNTIDLIVDATKGKLNVNMAVDVAKNSCLMPCFAYLFSKISKCKVNKKKQSIELEQIKE
jgi:hypothetical protein